MTLASTTAACDFVTLSPPKPVSSTLNLERQLRAVATEVSQVESVLEMVMYTKERCQTQYHEIENKLALYQTQVTENSTPVTIDLVSHTLPRLLTELRSNIQLNSTKAERILHHLEALRLERAELEHALKQKHRNSTATAV